MNVRTKANGRQEGCQKYRDVPPRRLVVTGSRDGRHDRPSRRALSFGSRHDGRRDGTFVTRPVLTAVVTGRVSGA